MKLNPLAKSKINWTQIIGLIAMVLALWGIDFTPEQQQALIVVIGMIGAALTWVWTRWGTPAAKGSPGLYAIDLAQLASVSGILALWNDWFGASAIDEKTTLMAAPAIGAQLLSIALRSLLPLMLRRLGK